jgi:hypothetical protein
MTIGTQLTTAKWARVSALVFCLCYTTGDAWAQGTITDKRVSLSYPIQHWSENFPYAELVGTEPNPADGIVRQLGWWYRLQGDTREYSFPVPDFQSYQNGEMYLEWRNLRGSGLQVTERVVVIDGEGPSGGVYITFEVQNLSGVPQTLEAFHFVEGPWYQTRRYYHVDPVSNNYLRFTDTTTGTVIRYRAEGASQSQASMFCDLPSMFGDQETTDLAGYFPAAHVNSDLCAAFQFRFTFTGGVGRRFAYVSLSSRLPADHVKGAYRNLTPHPGLLTCNSHPCQGGALQWFFKRTTYMQLHLHKAWSVAGWAGFSFGGVDDFDGDSDDELVVHNQTTGEIRIDGWKVDVPLYGNWALRSTGDFNRDGKADLLFQWVGRPGAGRDWSPLRIWLMNGHALIASVTPDDANVVLEPGWIVAGSADFNDDGYIDLLWHNPGSGDLMIWRMVGTVMTNITFPTPAKEEGSSWRVVAVGDFGVGSTRGAEAEPETGASDIVWQDELTGQVVVWHMNFAEQRTSRTVLSPMASIVGPR